MRVKEIIICNKSAFMIYVTQQEHDHPSFQTMVDNYKKTSNRVSVFISGTHFREETLKELIQEYSH